jgi:hypothetical protein
MFMTKPWVLPLAALVAMSACSPQQTPEAPTAQAVPVPEADPEAAVVNAAAAFFFVEDNGFDKMWSEGDFVVLQSEWDKSDGRTFREQLSAMLDGMSFWLLKMSKEEKSLVEQVLESAGDASMKVEVSSSELKSLELEERIVLDEAEEDWYYFDKVYVNKVGKEGKGRAVGGVMRPVFSPNMRYAFVRMNLLWSIHGGPVIMILEKKEAGWEVVYSDYTIHL